MNDSPEISPDLQEIVTLRKQLATVTQARDRDALDGQAALDECNNRIRDLQRQLAAMTAERDAYQTKARWKHTHDDSLECELAAQLAASRAKCAQLEEALNVLLHSHALDFSDVIRDQLPEVRQARKALAPTERPSA